MSDVITTDAQSLEITSGLVVLYEIIIGQGSNNTLYFHSEKDLDGNGNNKDLIFDGKTYVSLPMVMDNVTKQSDGAQNRPKLTIANVESIIKSGSAFKTEMSDGTWDAIVDGEEYNTADFTIEGLIGQRLVRRITLEKYCGSGVTAYEFPKETFIIDRVAAKSLIHVELELASPTDLQGVQLPRRNVIGKYCPWIYQGYEDDEEKSACYWKKNSQVKGTDSLLYSFYFTKDDEPLIKASYLTGSSTTNYINFITVTTQGNGYTSTPTVTIGEQWDNSETYSQYDQVFQGSNLYTIDASGTANGSGTPTHTSGAVSVGGLSLTYAGVHATATATVVTRAVTAVVDLEGESPSSKTSYTLDAAGTNADISVGDVVTGNGISGTVTVSNVPSTKTVTLSSAQTISDNTTLTFTSKKVTRIEVTNQGSGYGISPPTISITGGGGSGAAATADFNGRFWLGAYNATTSYSKGEYVSHNNLFWRSEDDTNQDNTPAENSAYWQIARTYTAWNSSTTYTVNNDTLPDFRKNPYVSYGSGNDYTIWRCVRNQSSSDYKTPGTSTLHWVRGDICGKLLRSCKQRYQVTPKVTGVDFDGMDSISSAQANTYISLPFGGFPSSRNFR